MSDKPDIDWSRLDYARFAELAGDDRLSIYEKIGFPDSYRQGFETQIFDDIVAKLPRLQEPGLTVVDIGPGCSEIPRMLIEFCRVQQHRLHLIDSPPMLAQLPDDPIVVKRRGKFPDCEAELADLRGRVDVVVCYSVFHYVFAGGNPFDFVDAILGLLAPGGQCLIGDIPNQSKRSRFFASEAGIAFHRRFTGSDTLPPQAPAGPQPGAIDDSVLMGIMARVRLAGADCYLVPQPDALPMANRREDLLIRRP